MIAQAGQEKPTQQIERVVQILEIVRVEESVSSPKREGKGRPCVDRRPLARAFVAKWRNGGAIYACGSQSARNENFNRAITSKSVVTHGLWHGIRAE